MAVYKPSNRAAALWRLRIALLSLILLFFAAKLGGRQWLYIAVVLVAAAVGWIYVPLWVRSCEYHVEPNRLAVDMGILYRREWILHTEQIQYTAVYRLPLQRVFFCATVVLHTAGGRVFLPDICCRTAMRLTEQLMDWTDDTQHT